MKSQFVTLTVPGKFISIRCRRCNQKETFIDENLDSKIEKFKAGHDHQPAPSFNKDRFVNTVIGRFGE